MIPNRLLFIWLGKILPWSAGAAIRSAAHTQNPSEIWLLAEGMEKAGPGWELIADLPGLEVLPADQSWFEGVAHGELAATLFSTLKSPASRANLLRLAVLSRCGGVYLDTDTIAVRPWDDLLSTQGFCGLEPLALPASLYRSLGFLGWPWAGLKLGFREVCARLPGGWKIFRPFENLYTMAVNNAVLGAEPGNALITAAFQHIADMPAPRRLLRFRLGTHLLQEITHNTSSPAIQVLPTPYFYPLGPEISAHWFRRGTADNLEQLLLPETRVVHWYNSVEGRFLGQEVDAAWVHAHSDTAFARLVRERVWGV